jgi:3',5'-cyclic AMP phosphodiesterase CpdA
MNPRPTAPHWPTPPPAPLNGAVLVIAHLSDIHLDGTDEIAARTRKVVDYLVSLRDRTRIDCVLVTGDLADHATDAEYEEVYKSVYAALPYPVLMCPGNHDRRDPYRRSLLRDHVGADWISEAPINESRVINGVLFLMCDSSIPQRNEGLLDDETLQWIDGELARATGPAFVCFHHPPVNLHQPFVDAIKLLNEERLADVLGRHRNVVAILCGHAHTPAATTFAGLPLVVAPGVKSSLLLPWESDAFATSDLPPAFAFHILGDDGRLTTHFRVVP